MPKVLHFADAHLDIVNYGRHDPKSGLPLRSLDFLNALDFIIDTAISEKVDMVLFAGDAYKDRNPSPTFQREWGRRMMRLSEAAIQTLLLVGNHDVSPAFGRAHTLQEFDTLQVPHVKVIYQPSLLRPHDLEGLPLQVIAIPWVSRSILFAALQSQNLGGENMDDVIEKSVNELIIQFLNDTDPGLPAILTAHASVEGAVYGAERSVMLGSDLILPGSLLRDERLDYIALGHIHKAQDLNEGAHPPIVYPGSIERVDFGEAADRKYFVIANVERGKTTLNWREIPGRKFIDRSVSLTSENDILETIMAVIPSQEDLTDSIFRLILEYPRQWESEIDEAALRRHAEPAFEFHLVRRPHVATRIRLMNEKGIASMSPVELLKLYWQSYSMEEEDIEELINIASKIITSVESKI